MPKVKKSETVPKHMRSIYQAIVALTDEYSEQHLNDEYAQLARYATAALCRKRPSPLVSSRANTWACGILYALGFVNFLFDKSQVPFCSANDLCEWFDVSKSTGSAKSKVVRDALGMMQLDPNWCLPSKLADNPMAWMIMVDGLIVDARHLPRQFQEAAYKKGIIPYIPADQE
jgi:hypothetical protein